MIIYSPTNVYLGYFHFGPTVVLLTFQPHMTGDARDIY